MSAGINHNAYNAPSPLFNRMKGIFGVVMLATGMAGCSLSMQLASLQNDDDITASIPGAEKPATLSPALDAEDWRRAQGALSLAIDPQGSGQPVNWDNPSTRRRGSFMPHGDIVLAQETICRGFSATLVEASPAGTVSETRHEGKACRRGPGEWVIESVLPLSTSVTQDKTGSARGPAAQAPSWQALPPKSPPMLPAPGSRSGTLVQE